MKPFSNIAECKNCNYFFDYHKQYVGEIEFNKNNESQKELTSAVKSMMNIEADELGNLNKLYLNNFTKLFKSEKHDEYNEIHIRKCMWQEYNSLTVYVEEIQDLLEIKEERLKTLKDIESIKNDIERFRDINRKNLIQLDILLEKELPEQFKLRAEVKRHLKDYRSSRKFLLAIPINEYHFVKQLRKKIRKKDQNVFVIKDRKNTRIYQIEYLIEKLRKVFVNF